ncbi:hypothetical protein QUF70_18425 [Desulfobacterales bacterium HSG17]|nr:hypothetical protein [Desulfobacterales bacterium HSG17]
MLVYKKNELNMTEEKELRRLEDKENVIKFSNMKKRSDKYDLLLEARMPKSTFSMLLNEDKEYVLSSETPEVFGTGEEFEISL